MGTFLAQLGKELDRLVVLQPIDVVNALVADGLVFRVAKGLGPSPRSQAPDQDRNNKEKTHFPPIEQSSCTVTQPL